MNIKQIENFLYYMQDKVQDCYKYETSQAIELFLKEIKGCGINEL